MPPGESALDHRGSARFTGRQTAFWYGLAAISYIGVGMFEKWLLTWFLGPMWLVAVVVGGPALVDRLRRR